MPTPACPAGNPLPCLDACPGTTYAVKRGLILSVMAHSACTACDKVKKNISPDRQMNNNFIKHIQKYLTEIEHASHHDEIVDAIADYIFSHQENLSDDDISLALINALSDWLHGKSQKINDIYMSLYFFWLACIVKAKIDVYYFGDLDRIQYLASRLNPQVISNIFFLPSIEERPDEIENFYSKIDNSIAPFVIYDPSGLKLAMKVANTRIISTISYYDLFNASAIQSTDFANDFSFYLSRQYKLLSNPEVKTVIIGNSYGYYGLPDPVLEHSVNLSMHSLSIKQIQQLTGHVLTHYPHIDNFIFCGGLFELYSDLFQSNDPFNRHVIDAFSQLVCHYNINDISNNETDGAVVFSRLAMQALPPNKNPALDDPAILNKIYDSAQPLLNSTDTVDLPQQNAMATQRAIAHSNSVKHKKTFEENKLRADAIAKSIAQSGKGYVWLTLPFPATYVENLSAEMVLSHREFFAKYNKDRENFIDLSEDRYFSPEDFRDGDHLNFAGARKLAIRLRERNIPL